MQICHKRFHAPFRKDGVFALVLHTRLTLFGSGLPPLGRIVHYLQKCKVPMCVHLYPPLDRKTLSEGEIQCGDQGNSPI